MESKSIREYQPLSAWHRRQAAMLYHYASLDYLKGLYGLVSNLINNITDPTLDLAKLQNSDSVLTDARWGSRDTSMNWANNAWPFLKDFQKSLSKDIAARPFEIYAISGTNDCLRALSEFSLHWMTPAEQDKFDSAVEAISHCAQKLDNTLWDYVYSRWDDQGFAYYYAEFAAAHKRIPNFRVRTDITAETGKAPIRTGVYVAQDDPNASLQFAWTGNGGGKLRPASTFNAIGLEALRQVGRRDLWFSEQKMYKFATASTHASKFQPNFSIAGQEYPDLAASAVAREAFIERPCHWFFVEMLEEDFENIDDWGPEVPIPEGPGRVPGGQPCPRAGFYFTPARAGSRRRFDYGEVMPKFDTQFGETIWQRDQNQN